MPSMELTSSSPAASQRGGIRLMPTPAGVPVKITSPGISVATADSLAIMLGTLKISWFVRAC